MLQSVSFARKLSTPIGCLVLLGAGMLLIPAEAPAAERMVLAENFTATW